ncbi:hypothetical protein SAMN06265222_11158 [Neorhodopirellula lusitana]|uniref:Uncharacterized protein n=1 Tax=Neorhodopirellula lusitana TaxID=445327 RepID=A0ABY1QEG8_9BACT|nr:hypothetical protein [Neorhodopirellula lusitana]SMP68421.1 hypothetical protein SAMN06265222_11158 [Neorhodopirellula lusitana]
MFRIALLAVAIAVAFSTTSPAGNASAAEIVSYRCEKWKTRHEHNPKQVEQIVDTLKKLKCEVQKHEHNGHADIKYRCPKWLEHKAKTHEDAHKLEAWLKALGFETKHQH